MRIEIATLESLDRYWQLRLRALREHPEAFGEAYAEAVALTGDEVRHRFESSWNHRDNRVFGAVAADGALAGMVGVARSHREKKRHRADIWGTYVASEYRGQGVADALMGAAIDWCRSLDGVLQIHLEVISSNGPAVRSYERIGFVRYGRRPRAEIVDGIALDSDQMILILDDYPMPSAADLPL